MASHSDSEEAPEGAPPRAPATDDTDDTDDEAAAAQGRGAAAEAAEAAALAEAEAAAAEAAQRAQQLFAECLKDTPLFRRRLRSMEKQVARYAVAGLGYLYHGLSCGSACVSSGCAHRPALPRRRGC